MKTLLAALGCGLLFGFGLRRFPNLAKRIPFAITMGLFALIFAMGIQVGGSPEVMESVVEIGSQAALFALFTVTGSVVFSLPLALWWRKRQRRVPS